MTPGHKSASASQFIPSSRVELPDTDEEEDETWQETVRHITSSIKAAGPIYKRGIRTMYSTTIERQQLNDLPSASHTSPAEHQNGSHPQASTSTLWVPCLQDDEDDEDDEDMAIIDIVEFVAYNEDKGKRVSRLR